MRTESILLVEPETIVRHAMKESLNQTKGYQVCAEADGIEAALDCTQRLRPGLVVTELVLQGLSGLELIRKIREKGFSSRIVVLTSLATPEVVRDAMDSGAHAYVLKYSPFEHLLLALKRAASGQTYLESVFPNSARGKVSSRKQAALDPLHELTPREREIFLLLVTGLRNSEIAQRLCISPRTVETHRSRLARKLRCKSTAEMIRLAYTHQLIAA